MLRTPGDRRANPDGRQAFPSLCADLINRLLPVCSSFAREELADLAAQMTRIRIRYDRDTAVPSHF
jgi:hypothetical protein